MPYKDIEKQRQYWREYKKRIRKNRQDKGLCPECGKPRTPSKKLCASCAYKHLIKAKKYWRKYQGRNAENKRRWVLRMVGENTCYECGAPLKEDESKTCKSCRTIWHTLRIRGVIKYEITQ